MNPACALRSGWSRNSVRKTTNKRAAGTPCGSSDHQGSAAALVVVLILVLVLVLILIGVLVLVGVLILVLVAVLVIVHEDTSFSGCPLRV